MIRDVALVLSHDDWYPRLENSSYVKVFLMVPSRNADINAKQHEAAKHVLHQLSDGANKILKNGMSLIRILKVVT